MTDGSSSAAPIAVRLPEYTQAQRLEVLGESPDPFGVAHARLTWLAKDDHFGISKDGRLVAHAGLVALPATIGEVSAQLAGLGGVAVAPDQRGRGLARLVVAAVMDHARSLGLDYGLLFCRPPVAPIYQRLGWRLLEQDVHVNQPDGPVVMPLCTMWTPLNQTTWPPGEVRLLSLPM